MMLHDFQVSDTLLLQVRNALQKMRKWLGPFVGDGLKEAVKEAVKLIVREVISGRLAPAG